MQGILTLIMTSVEFRYASDQSLFADFDDHADIVRFLAWAERNPITAVRNLHPAYSSVLVVFDPLSTDHASIQAAIEGAHLERIELAEPRTVEIPVRYGGADGPDLDDVAELHSLTREQVIELHSGAVYSVYFLGFVPGFAYLGGLPPEIATPRLPSPRTHVPAGSVGIAGNQTGVYPFITPGGWRLIGRTDVKMFDPERAGMSLLRAGDRVRFRAA